MEQPEINGAALEEINDADLEEIIVEATEGNKEALKLLLYSRWLSRLLNEIADWVWRQHKIQANEHGETVQDAVADTIRCKIDSVTNSNHVLWRDCLKAWCYTVAENWAKNVFRHLDVEHRHRNSTEHQHTKIIVHGIRRVAPCSTTISQEKEIELKEQYPFQQSLKWKIRQTIWNLYTSLTPEDKELVSLWADGKTLQQIHEETGVNIKTASRRQGKIQKKFVEKIRQAIIDEIGQPRTEETGVEEILEELLTHRSDGLKGLVAHSLKKMDQCFSYAARAGV